MLHQFLAFLFKKGKEARKKAEAARIRLLQPPSHYQKHRPPHIPDPAPDSLPWKKPRNY